MHSFATSAFLSLFFILFIQKKNNRKIQVAFIHFKSRLNAIFSIPNLPPTTNLTHSDTF